MKTSVPIRFHILFQSLSEDQWVLVLMGTVMKILKQIWATFCTYWPLVLWIIVNYLIFKEHFFKYKNAPEHFHLRSMIGLGLCISRATAAMLNFSCCMLLLPMCRSLNLLLHHFLGMISPEALMFWIKNARNFHIMCATSIVIESISHSIAHIINALNFSLHYNEEFPSLNWAEYSGQPVWEMIFTSVVGVTGFAMMCVLMMMSITSLKKIRDYHYQIFWFVHHSYLLFLIVLLSHPMSGKLKEVGNISNLTTCRSNIQNIENDSDGEFKYNFLCGSKPEFISMKSETWLWIMPPFIVFIIDRIFWSLKRNLKQLHVLRVLRLPGCAIHLVLQSPSLDFLCQPGQYILLQCPVISSIEWHPFSVVSFSSSEQPSLSVLIRAKGDWTEELLSKVLVPFAHQEYATEIYDKNSGKPVTFLVDGPFRSPLEEILNSSAAICIAAGIGITPFISIFNYLLSSAEQKSPKHIHLVWLLRDPQQLTWCASMLCDLHEKCWQDNIPDRFVFQIHITKDFNAVNLQEVLQRESKLLIPRIKKGRPVWKEVFDQIKEMYPRQTLHIFTSGPKSLVEEIGNACKKLKGKGINIKYAHETF